MKKICTSHFFFVTLLNFSNVIYRSHTNNMKKIVKALILSHIGLAIFAISLLLTGCQSDDIKINQLSQFDIAVTELTESHVSLTISHDGSNRDAYYGIYFQGGEALANDYLSSYFKNNTAEKIKDQAWNQRKRFVTKAGLMPKTEYTFVVFALDTLGKWTGVMASCSFSTRAIPDSLVFQEEPTWKLDWFGETIHENDYWTRIDKTVLADTMKQSSYMCLIPKSIIQRYKDIRKVIYWALGEKRQELNDENVDWHTLHMVAKGSTHCYFQREEGDYYAMAIGIEKDGSPTGLYAISDAHRIDEYTPLDTYADLIGSWRLTDAEGLSQTVEIKKHKVNKSLSIVGWAGRQWPVILTFNPNNNYPFTLSLQCVVNNLSITSSNHDFIGDVYLLGWYLNSNGVTKWADDFTELAYCYKSNSRYRIVKAFRYTNLPDTQYGLYYGVAENGSFAGALNNSSYTFPITLVRL